MHSRQFFTEIKTTKFRQKLRRFTLKSTLTNLHLFNFFADSVNVTKFRAKYLGCLGGAVSGCPSWWGCPEVAVLRWPSWRDCPGVAVLS
jgi:hypothetical protein